MSNLRRSFTGNCRLQSSSRFRPPPPPPPPPPRSPPKLRPSDRTSCSDHRSFPTREKRRGEWREGDRWTCQFVMFRLWLALCLQHYSARLSRRGKLENTAYKYHSRTHMFGAGSHEVANRTSFKLHFNLFLSVISPSFPELISLLFLYIL